MVRKAGLGRGLGSLIPQNDFDDRTSTYRSIPTTHIRPNPNQPRKSFEEEALSSLAASIAVMGIIQPILVNEIEDGQYQIIAGERRWRAARRVGLDTVPAIVQTTDHKTNLEQALVENLHREDLNPIEEAMAYQSLLEEYEFTHETLATRVGKSRAVITNAIRLLQLPTSAQRLLVDRKISPGHARLILSVSDRLKQETLAKIAAEEDLSVRALEQLLSQSTVQKQKNAKNNSTQSKVFKPVAIVELEQILEQSLDTPIVIQMPRDNSGKHKGKVTIEFDNLEDLKRIAQQIVTTDPN